MRTIQPDLMGMKVISKTNYTAQFTISMLVKCLMSALLHSSDLIHVSPSALGKILNNFEIKTVLGGFNSCFRLN